MPKKKKNKPLIVELGGIRETEPGKWFIFPPPEVEEYDEGPIGPFSSAEEARNMLFESLFEMMGVEKEKVIHLPPLSFGEK